MIRVMHEGIVSVSGPGAREWATIEQPIVYQLGMDGGLNLE